MVEAKELMSLGLTTLRKMGIFQKHPRVFIEEIETHPVKVKNRVRWESCRGEDVSNTKAKGQNSISDAECLD